MSKNSVVRSHMSYCSTDVPATGCWFVVTPALPLMLAAALACQCLLGCQPSIRACSKQDITDLSGMIRST